MPVDWTPATVPQFRGHGTGRWAGAPVTVDWGESAVDLAGLVVPLAGRLGATGGGWEPDRLLDSRGVADAAARKRHHRGRTGPAPPHRPPGASPPPGPPRCARRGGGPRKFLGV